MLKPSFTCGASLHLSPSPQHLAFNSSTGFNPTADSSLKLTLALFGGIGTAIACYAGYKYYRKRQEYLEATANHRLLDDIITARSQRMQSDPVDLTSEGSGDNSRYPHYQGVLFTGWWPHTMIIKWLKSLSLK